MLSQNRNVCNSFSKNTALISMNQPISKHVVFQFAPIYGAKASAVLYSIVAWLYFLGSDDPKDILRLTDKFPMFREL